jgi:DNA-binding response OmpR family regulator
VKKIALVEHDPTTIDRLIAILTGCGDCFPFRDGQTFLGALENSTYDIACLAWNLPNLSGVEVVKRIRGHKHAPRMPVILITTRSSDEDIVTGLLSGADDYVTKPFSAAVLVARVGALLRRRTHAADNHMEIHGDYAFEHSQSSVVFRGEEQILTAKEFNLALLLFRNLHRPLARRYIMDSIWGHGADVSSRTLDTHASRLKFKLGLWPENGYKFGTVYGFGYLLEKQASPGVEP